MLLTQLLLGHTTLISIKTKTRLNGNRIHIADFLKGLAVLFMIKIHLTEVFLLPASLNSVYGKVTMFLGGIPAAPMFMLIMGYFLAKAQPSIADAIKRGGKLIALGLLLNIGMNANLIYQVQFNNWNANLWEYIFGVDILILAGLSIIFLSCIGKRTVIINGFIAIILLFILARLLPDINYTNYLTPYFYGHQHWAYFSLLPWFAYPLSGYLLFKINEQYPQFLFKYIFIGLAVVISILFWEYGYKTSIQLPSFYNHDVFFFIYTLSFMYVYYLLINLLLLKLNSKINNYIQWIGKNVTTIYVLQWLIIGNLGTYIYQTQTIKQTALWFIPILLAVSILTLLKNKLIKS